MGYDLHITRADVDWENEDANPITAEEWLNIVAKDETLTVSWNDENELIVTEWTPIENPNLGRQMDWHHGRVSTKYLPLPAYLKMLELAEQLGGRVLGDDGELFQTINDHERRSQYPPDQH
jgi:hypothetical protein